MSATASGTRLAAQQPSKICQKHIEDRETRESLMLLLSIVKSCYGPHGRLKMIQNACGGHVTVTSTSTLLFSALSISKPVLKLIATSVKTHLQQFNDGGLFSSLLALFTINESLDMVDVNRTLMCDIFDYLKKFCVESLNAQNNCLKFDLDFSCVDMMLTLVKSVVGTKCACSLNDDELSFLCQLVLETFLKTVQDDTKVRNSFSHVDVITVEGSSPLQSCLQRGVLFEKCHSEKLGQNLQVQRIPFGKSVMIRCCVIDISLSGDSEELLDINFETNSNYTLSDGIVCSIMHLCKKFISDGVGILFCQKVVHPAIQQFLQEKGVLVIDRLGLACAKAVLELTGCTPLSSLVATPASSNYGHINSLDHLEVGKKHFYHIKSSQSLVSTVVLHGRNEVALAELKHVFRVGLDTLQMAVYKKEMVPGAGCFETCLADAVRKHVLANEVELMSKFSCSKSRLHVASQIFCQSLMSVAASLDSSSQHFTDSVIGHHWTAKPNSSLDLQYSKTLDECCCGMIKNNTETDFQFREILFTEPRTLQWIASDTDTLRTTTDLNILKRSARVLDPLQTKLNAFHIAMSTACMVLRIGNFVCDTN